MGTFSRTAWATVALALGVPAAAYALYGGADAPASEGESAVYFDFRSARGSGSCSGTLIAERAVLTAAHCVRSTSHGEHRVRSVRVGNPAGRTTRAPVERVAVDPDFDVAHPERGHDAAVLVLREPVTGRAMPRLASAEDDPTEQGTRLTVFGFGLTRRGRAIVRSRRLRSVSFEYLSPFHCFSGDVARMATTRMCAATPDGGVCPGDSGSGAIRDVDGTKILVGIVSLAIENQQCSDTAAVLTRVSSVRAFIDGALP